MEQFSGEISLAEEIAEILRGRILKGDYEIGEKMAEKIVADELKVSRTPVRKAFRLLISEGLMEYVPNKGCFAKGFSKQDIQDIYAVRKSVELMAVTWAVQRISDEEIAELKEQCDLMEFYTARQDHEKLLKINYRFHEIIYGATRSRFLAQILRSYQEYVEEARKITVTNVENLPEIYQEHLQIFHAIKEKDGDKAEKLIGEHLDSSKKRTEHGWTVK